MKIKKLSLTIQWTGTLNLEDDLRLSKALGDAKRILRSKTKGTKGCKVEILSSSSVGIVK